MVTDCGSYFPEGGNILSAPTIVSNSSSTKHNHSQYPHNSYEVHGFPRLLTVQGSASHAESYCRSLLLENHGFPLWYPKVAIPQKAEYLKKGVSIGDVGLIDREGSFKFYFNIFLPADHPFHAGRTPREFRPINPPLDASEIAVIPDYFKPGTIIASEGIKVVRHGTDPLDASFYSKRREGGILILPHGASRKDMNMTDRLHEYVQRNAPHWYQVINMYSDRVHYPNGSLVVVTGCDKTKEYASSAFFNADRKNQRISELQYTWRPDFKIPWSGELHAAIHWYQPRYGEDISAAIDDPTEHQCVFVRTLRISLSNYAWARSLPIVPSPTPFVSLILQKRSIFHRCLDRIAILRKSTHPEEKLVRFINSSDCKQLFEPNIMIAQILLCQFPDVDISLIDDFLWCSRSSSGPGTLKNVLKSVDRVLETCEVVEKDGRLTLVPKTAMLQSSDHVPNIFKRIQRYLVQKNKPRVDTVYVCDRYCVG